MPPAHAGYFDTYKNAFHLLNWDLIGFSAILFVVGVLLAPTALERNLHWLTAYPEWVFNKIQAYVEKKPPVWLLFLLIFCVNSLSVFLVYVSGFAILLPYLLIIWAGINSGVLLYKNLGGGFALAVFFLNPVALFELPANWIAYSLGIEMSLFYFKTHSFEMVYTIFKQNWIVFIWFVIPLLFIGALIEASLIHKFGTGEEDQNNHDGTH
jgi:hypothetical protein